MKKEGNNLYELEKCLPQTVELKVSAVEINPVFATDTSEMLVYQNGFERFTHIPWLGGGMYVQLCGKIVPASEEFYLQLLSVLDIRLDGDIFWCPEIMALLSRMLNETLKKRFIIVLEDSKAQAIKTGTQNLSILEIQRLLPDCAGQSFNWMINDEEIKVISRYPFQKKQDEFTMMVSIYSYSCYKSTVIFGGLELLRDKQAVFLPVTAKTVRKNISKSDITTLSDELACILHMSLTALDRGGQLNVHERLIHSQNQQLRKQLKPGKYTSLKEIFTILSLLRDEHSVWALARECEINKMLVC